MNEHYINIKVDREERPDVDAVYMSATQAMTGQGGWPMTCVLTPEGEPFFAGTYFPPEPRQGSPAFTQVLQALSDAWNERRDEVLTVSKDVLEHLRSGVDPIGGALGTEQLDAAVLALAKQYDAEAGGIRQPSEVPAVDGAGVPAPQRRSYGVAAGARPRRRYVRGNGARRDVRPAVRRLRALQRRPVLAGAALREDALRQRAAAAGLPALVAADEVAAGRADRPRDRPVHHRRARHAGGRLRVGARRRQRRARGHVLRVEPQPADAHARPRRRRLGDRAARRDRRWHVRARLLDAAAA